MSTATTAAPEGQAARDATVQDLHAAASDLRFVADGGVCDPRTLREHADVLLTLADRVEQLGARLTASEYEADLAWRISTSTMFELVDLEHRVQPRRFPAGWTTCTLNGVVHAYHVPCAGVFLVPQAHDCLAAPVKPHV